MINVGLVGFGLSGQVFHAPFIYANPNFKLSKIVERNSDNSKKLYPDIEIVRDYQDLLNDVSIKLIVITTPNYFHFEMAKEALLAEKHVIIEKPFTTNSEQADELINLSKEKSKILSVFHNRRFDGDFQTVKKVVENKLLGRLVEYEAHFDRFRNVLKYNAWREKILAGSGILFDLGSHLIDQALVLFGLPNFVTADIRIQRESEVDDYFELILDYGRLKVTLKAGMLVREPGPRFILHGTEGSFIKYGIDPQEDLLRQGVLPGGADWGKENEKNWGTLNTDIKGLHFSGKLETIQGSYAAFYENIYDAIVLHRNLVVKPEEARNTIRVIELAFESNSKKKTLPFSEIT